MTASLDCPVCGHKFQAEAAAGDVATCPRCGDSMKSALTYDLLPPSPLQAVSIEVPLGNETNPITIQRTAKRWKKLTAIGMVVALAGLAILVIGIAMLSLNQDGVIHANADTWFKAVLSTGFPLLIIGLGIKVYAALMAWWHHG